MQGMLPNVAPTKVFASDRIPGRLRILRCSSGIAHRRSTRRPPRLGDPDRFSSRDRQRFIMSGLEDSFGVLDAVILIFLVVE